MSIDFTHKYVATVGQDRLLRIYDIATGVDLHSYRTSASEAGAVTKITIDTSGMYVATSSTDRRIRIHNFYTGECIGVGAGHSESVTALKFLNPTQLVSTSADGCVMVWRLPVDATRSIEERMAEIDESLVTPNVSPDPRRKAERDGSALSVASDELEMEARDPVSNIDWNALPSWARKQVMG